MKIIEQYSHLNGFEYLQYHHAALWQEIVEVIESIDAAAALTKASREIRKVGRTLYSPVDLNAQFKTELSGRGWSEERASYYLTATERLARETMNLPMADQKAMIADAGETPIFSYNQTDFVKDRIAVEVQFGKYSFVAYDLFVKHMAFYSRDQIDCGIEILPVKAFQNEMSSGVGYYEGEVYNVYRQGRGVPSVPLVVIGVGL